MKILSLSTAGSHLKTLEAIECELRSRSLGYDLTICEPLGFYGWTTANFEYEGLAKRITITPVDCGLKKGRAIWLSDSSLKENLFLRSSFASIQRKMTELIDEIQPDLLLTAKEAGWVEFGLLTACQRRGVKTVVIQEGPFVLDRYRRASVYLRKLWYRLVGGIDMPVLMATSNAALFCVASNHYKGLALKNSQGRCHVEITGLPRYDSLSGFSRKPQKKLLFVGQPLVEHQVLSRKDYLSQMRLIICCLRWVQDEMGYKVVVRRHPSQILFDQLVAPLLPESFGVENESMNLFQSLSECSSIWGHYSSCLVEAMGVGVPVLSWRLSPYTDWFEKAGVPVVSNFDEFIGWTKGEIRSDLTKAKKKAHEEIGELDGLASRRLIDLVL